MSASIGADLVGVMDFAVAKGPGCRTVRALGLASLVHLVAIAVEDIAEAVPKGFVGANDAIYLTAADDGSIYSVNIDDSGQDGVALFGASDNVTIHDTKISGCTRFGINNRGDNNHFIGNRIDTTGSDGIFLQAGGTNCICALNRISGWTGEAIDNDEPSSEVAHNQLIV